MMSFAGLRFALVPLVLFAAVVSGVHSLDHHNLIVDVSHDARNSLDRKSVQVLAMLPAPLEAVALVPDQPAIRTAVRDFYARYQREKPNLTLRFVPLFLATGSGTSGSIVWI